MIAQPIPNFPRTATADDWRRVCRTLDAERSAATLRPAEALGSTFEERTVAGVRCFLVVPRQVDPAKPDRLLVHLHGGAFALYAGGADQRPPLLSPVYGDLRRFPPTILVAGTRDLFLSNTVRLHRALRAAGSVAELHVFEGQSHADYLKGAPCPEAADAPHELAVFLDQHLARSASGDRRGRTASAAAEISGCWPQT